MKKLCFMIALVLPLFTISCDKNLEEDGPLTSEMSGLGDNEGSPSGIIFKFPDGIELIGDISGDFTSVNMWNWESEQMSLLLRSAENKQIKTRNPQAGIQLRTTPIACDIHQGSGGLVSVLFNLKNTKNQAGTVEFPAGLLIESASGEYQNGLLVKKTSVVVPANGTLAVGLDMYCCNLSRHASDNDAVYKWPVITNNAELKKLFEAAKGKRINREEFTYTDVMDYYICTSTVQSIVWGITEGSEGFTEERRVRIEGLPDSQ